MMQQLRLDLFGEQYRMWLLYSGKNILEPELERLLLVS